MQDKTVFLAHLSGQRTAGPPWTSRHAGEASTRLPSLHQLPSPPVQAARKKDALCLPTRPTHPHAQEKVGPSDELPETHLSHNNTSSARSSRAAASEVPDSPSRLRGSRAARPSCRSRSRAAARPPLARAPRSARRTRRRALCDRPSTSSRAQRASLGPARSRSAGAGVLGGECPTQGSERTSKRMSSGRCWNDESDVLGGWARVVRAFLSVGIDRKSVV